MDNYSFSAGYNATDQMDTTQNKTNVKRIQNVMPLVIQQILNSQGSEFNLFGTPAQIIKLVAIVRNFEVQTTKVTYTIEDSTGVIKAILWLESDDDSNANIPNIKEGCYSEVFGSIRNQDGETFVMVLKMFPVNDCNVITTHLLETIHNRLYTEAESKKMVDTIKSKNPGKSLASSMNMVIDDDHNESVPNGFTTFQNKVFRIIMSDNSQNGIHKDELLKQFPSNQHHSVISALSFLSDEGHIYSTTDNDHFKATSI